MSNLKNVATEMNLIVTKAPIQVVDKPAIEAAVARMRVTVPGAQNMSIEHLTVIAQDSILYRTVPGRDMHYFISKGQLQRIPDYKYLKNFASFKEQMLSGDDSAVIEDSCRPLTEEEKATHGIEPHCIAAICRIVTARERRAFAEEVRRWKDIGFTVQEAMEAAKETYGELGTSAVGVIDPTELDRNGKPVEPPHGWSFLQLAEKLAFKNAVNRKYGQPTADEMQAMAYRMAIKAMPQDWQNVDPTIPREAQARQADFESVAREVSEASANLTPTEHKERLGKQVIIMRDSDDNGIGESDKERFTKRVKREITFYASESQIWMTLARLGLDYAPDNEEMLFDELAKDAAKQADLKAAA